MEDDIKNIYVYSNIILLDCADSAYIECVYLYIYTVIYIYTCIASKTKWLSKEGIMLLHMFLVYKKGETNVFLQVFTLRPGNEAKVSSYEERNKWLTKV